MGREKGGGGGDASVIQPQERPRELRQSKAWSEISSFTGKAQNQWKQFGYSAEFRLCSGLGLSEWRYSPVAPGLAPVKCKLCEIRDLFVLFHTDSWQLAQSVEQSRLLDNSPLRGKL